MAGYTKKKREITAAGKPAPMIYTLFFYPLRGCGRLRRPACRQLVRLRLRGAPFRCGETSGSHYRAAAAAYFPARFFRRKNGVPKRMLYRSGGPDGRAVRVCEAN